MDGIEGSWNGFSFHRITPKEIWAVLEHLRSCFYLHEPIQKCVGTSGERMNDLDTRISTVLREGNSFLAKNLEDGKIAGCLIISHYGLEEGEKSAPLPFTVTSPITLKVRAFLEALHHTEPSDLFKYFGSTKYAEIFIVSVDPNCRGKGLASEMYRRGIQLLGESGLKNIVSDFSNPISRRVGEKFGFKEIKRLTFSEVLDADEKPLFENAKDEFVTTTVLQLK